MWKKIKSSANTICETRKDKSQQTTRRDAIRWRNGSVQLGGTTHPPHPQGSQGFCSMKYLVNVTTNYDVPYIFGSIWSRPWWPSSNNTDGEKRWRSSIFFCSPTRVPRRDGMNMDEGNFINYKLLSIFNHLSSTRVTIFHRCCDAPQCNRRTRSLLVQPMSVRVGWHAVRRV